MWLIRTIYILHCKLHWERWVNISVSEQLINTYPYTLTQHYSTDNKLALMLGLGSGRLYSYFDTEIYPKQASTLAFENHVMILLGLKIHSSHIHSVY